ncbi:hypothetical protein C8R44DRAFT_757390 [Mycena epipterygia]|nr:hypothetical protein C8R44DRAFT_757390 [Mycena epipterygia]
MANWMSLPVETWLEISNIVRFSSVQDLADLCLTCSQLMSIARPILYCDVILSTIADLEPNLAALETFSLLARDPDLARSVRKLTLDAAAEELEYNDTPILVDIASLKNMTQLKTLTIIGEVFRHAGEAMKSEFIETLGGLPLEELSFPGPGGCFYHFSEEQFAQIANLKSIECYSEIDQNDYFGPRCLRLLSSSVSSLTSLSLSVMYINDWSLQLFAMRFPLLRSLTVDTWDEGMHCPEGFDSFLLAQHENLERLDMGYTPRNQINPAALVFNDGILHPDCLPNLRAFKGHCLNVETMVRAGMHSLANSLTKLTLGVGRIDNPLVTINQMLDAIQTSRFHLGRLTALKELDFDFFYWQDEEHDAIPAFIRRWGEVCGPSLEVWNGLVPFVWTWSPEEFAGFFSAFSKLRVLWIANDSTVFGVFPRQEEDDGEEEEEENEEQVSDIDFPEYVRILAQNCGSLEEVWVTWGYVKSCWKIERGPDTRLVVRCAD